MYGPLTRILLLIAGVITSWFVAEDAVNFTTIQMIVAVLLFVSVVLLVALWPKIWARRASRGSKPPGAV